jgi:EAL domain-containing protein (putative c-di-GMP-specific phosphodiesterase class I)/AmiR/NasT family two-component response regulator
MNWDSTTNLIAFPTPFVKRETEPVVKHRFAGLRVLVVEDDPFLRAITMEILADLGVGDVVGAADGTEGLALVDQQSTHPDVVICDIAMPHMDGIVFIRHLANRDYRGSILLLSGASDRIIGAVADLVRRREMRLLGAMVKPIDPAVLARLLDESQVEHLHAETTRISKFSSVLSAEELRRGLDAGSVYITVQPKISMATRHVVGAEALLRWRDTVRGTVLPAAVVSSAEANGLIDELTACVFRQAARCLAEYCRGGRVLSMSVNLSVENFATLDLPETLLGIAAQEHVDPRQITLEVTESRLMGNLATSLEVLGRLSLAGFRLSMDDFGTGYSTLEKLKQLPFDELKVDRAFVSGATHDTVARTILRSSIELGHALGLTVVAEGIETGGDLELLAALGCDEMQGYYFARPMLPAEFPAWVTAFHARPIGLR